MFKDLIAFQSGKISNFSQTYRILHIKPQPTFWAIPALPRKKCPGLQSHRTKFLLLAYGMPVHADFAYIHVGSFA